tara:strand:- start:749 stop:949 length:201 start_codon:yes stop_codon:yes gene_type:complete
MEKSTTHIFTLTYEELVNAVVTYILREDPSSNVILGTTNSTKRLDLDDIQIENVETLYLMVDINSQ